MKKLIGTLAFAAVLMVGTVAQSATLIIATRGDHPSIGSGNQNEWTLSIESTVAIAAIGITAPDSATFVINSANANIAAFGSGSSYGAGATDGRFSLNLNPVTCSAPGGVTTCVPFAQPGAPTVLGVFTAASVLSTLILADDDSVGGTAFDGGLNILTDFEIVNRIPAPEPAAALLLGFGLAALGLVRRKGA